MKSLPTFALFLLLGVTIVQWALISYLLQERHQRNTNGDKNCEQPLAPTASISRERLSTLDTNKALVDASPEPHSNVVKSNDSDLKQFPGVAAAIMFSAPAWFHRRFPVLIQNTLSNIPPGWAVQLFVNPPFWNERVLPYHPGMPRLLEVYKNRIIVTELPKHLRKIKKPNQQIPLEPWFWETLVADRVLMFSGNGIMCTHGNTYENWESLQELDFCGCPGKSRLLKQGGDSSTHSYRNRTVMLEALQYAKENNLRMFPPEGAFFVETLVKMNNDPNVHNEYKLATRQDTLLFGGVKTTNSTIKGHLRPIPPPPMVVSGTQAHLSFQEREDLLTLCPELKVIFPSLHEPSCFGAHPEPAKCKASICALQDKLPDSGC